MTLIVKHLKIGLFPGDPVPPQDPENRGNVGRYLEEVLRSQGLTVNPTGIDVPDLKMELKTRKNDAVAAFSICRMSVTDILTTDFEDSRLYQSIENLLLVKYNDILNVVTSVNVYNWANDPIILAAFKYAYNSAKLIFSQGTSVYTKKTVVRGNNSFGYFEIDRGSSQNDIYEFRISKNNLKKLEITNKQVKFKELFEIK